MNHATAALLAALTALSACSSGEQGFGNTSQNSNTDQGNGSMEISPSKLVIEGVNWEDGVAGSGTLTVTSTGDGTLRLYDVALSNTGDGALYMVPVDEDINLATGVSREFVINATLTEFEKVEGSLRIQSNDGEQQLAAPRAHHAAVSRRRQPRVLLLIVRAAAQAGGHRQRGGLAAHPEAAHGRLVGGARRHGQRGLTGERRRDGRAPHLQ